MSDTMTQTVLSVIVTVGDRLSKLAIKDGQLIVVEDKHRVAFDFDGKRVFYNQLEELQTDEERAALAEPVNGCYYFVIDTAVLWTYQDGWIPITTPPEEIVFIGVSFPELGSARKLYVNKGGGISIWDDETNGYIVVADKNAYVSEADVNSLFE